jgi:dihydrofolate reductase
MVTSLARTAAGRTRWARAAEFCTTGSSTRLRRSTAPLLQEAIDGCGAVVMGRKSFDQTEGEGGWGDGGPVGDTRCFVVTHNKPTTSYPPVFTFVTDGVASAIEQAKQVAGDKGVGLHGATVMQQALPLGLVDEIHVHVIPVLLGSGTPLFSTLDAAITLERTTVQVTPAATHLAFRVVR